MDTVAREYLTILRTKILPYATTSDALVSAKTPVVEPNLTNIKSHLFKLLHALLPRFPEIRARLATSRPVHPRNDLCVDPLRDFEAVVAEVEGVVQRELQSNPEEKVSLAHGLPLDVDSGLVRVGEWNCIPGGWVGPQRKRGVGVEEEVTAQQDAPGWDIPFYRCQPNFRPLPEEAVKRGAMSASALCKGEQEQGNGADDVQGREDVKRAKVVD